MKKGVKTIVLNAVLAGCNTTRDVADATGLTFVQAHNCVRGLLKMGVIRNTGRVIRTTARGQPMKVFEVVGGERRRAEIIAHLIGEGTAG